MDGGELLGDVRQRQVGEEDLPLPHHPHLDQRVRRPDQVAVAEHHALGRAGGAGGVDQRPQLVRLERVHRLPVRLLAPPHPALEDLGERRHPRRPGHGRVHHHQRLQPRQHPAQRPEPLERGLVLGDGDLGLAVAQDVGHLLGAGGGVQAHRHPSQRHRRQIGDHPLLPVEREDAEAVPPSEAQAVEPHREGAHPRRVLPPGGGQVVPPPLGPEGGAVSQPRRLVVEDVEHGSGERSGHGPAGEGTRTTGHLGLTPGGPLTIWRPRT